jgi:hypothetical protein
MRKRTNRQSRFGKPFHTRRQAFRRPSATAVFDRGIIMPLLELPGRRAGRRRLAALAAAAVSVVFFTSCRGGPTPVRPPSISASSAGSEAMELYDTNGDGQVAGDELEKAPGLKAALPRLDADGDGGVTADEVAARVAQWQKAGVGLISFSFTVTLNGSPLSDAVVTFEPEAFLGDDVKPASCTTSSGVGGPTIAKEDLPDPTWPPGMQHGIYKVKVSKIIDGRETIPAKYNEATVLGQEVAQDVPEIGNRRVVYALSTN